MKLAISSFTAQSPFLKLKDNVQVSELTKIQLESLEIVRELRNPSGTSEQRSKKYLKLAQNGLRVQSERHGEEIELSRFLFDHSAELNSLNAGQNLGKVKASIQGLGAYTNRGLYQEYKSKLSDADKKILAKDEAVIQLKVEDAVNWFNSKINVREKKR